MGLDIASWILHTSHNERLNPCYQELENALIVGGHVYELPWVGGRSPDLAMAIAEIK